MINSIPAKHIRYDEAIGYQPHRSVSSEKRQNCKGLLHVVDKQGENHENLGKRASIWNFVTQKLVKNKKVF